MAGWITEVLILDYFLIPLLAITFTWLWIYDYWRNRDLPPGPRGWPVVGSLFQLGPRTWETLERMSKTYGPVFSLKLGYQHVVVLNDYESVREALIDQGEIFSGRPPMFMLDYGIKSRDVATSTGSTWKKQRKFMLQNMKSFGFGKSSSETLIMDNIQMIVNEFDASKGAPLNFEHMFFIPILATIWKYCSSHSLSKDDSNAKALNDMVRINEEGMGNQLVNFMPVLRFLPGGGLGFWRHQREFDKLWKFLTDEIESHKRSIKSGQHRDFIDVYLQEIEARKGSPDEEKPPFNNDFLTGTLFDLFMGGSDTMNNTLLWGFLFLSLHTEVQQKIQAEMDDVIGRARTPCFSDITKLPYLEATIQEIHRYISLVPLSVYHAPTRDTIFRGYRIPRGTTIIQNIHAVHNDPKCWTDPHLFQPRRFLDEKGRIVKLPYLMAFSVGPRICPGEAMARMQLHLFFGVLLHKYRFTLPPGGDAPSLEPEVGLTLAPHPYSLCVTPR